MEWLAMIMAANLERMNSQKCIAQKIDLQIKACLCLLVLFGEFLCEIEVLAG